MSSDAHKAALNELKILIESHFDLIEKQLAEQSTQIA